MMTLTQVYIVNYYILKLYHSMELGMNKLQI